MGVVEKKMTRRPCQLNIEEGEASWGENVLTLDLIQELRYLV